MSALKGRILEGRNGHHYRIEEPLDLDELGSPKGAMARVFRVFDVQRSHYQAAKIINPRLLDDEPEIRNRFLGQFYKEARIMEELQHPNIVRLHDYNIQGDLPFLIMDYIEGETLDDRMRRESRFTLKEALTILEPVIMALGYAHSRGVVHRDLKPSNILLDWQGKAYLSDFGIARAAQESGLSSRTALTLGPYQFGTPMYMAPEQALRLTEAVGPQTDQYSLAVLAWRMLAGRYYLARMDGKDSSVDYTKLVIGTSPLPLSRYAPNIPPRAEQAIVKALSKSPYERFDTVLLFLDELRKALLNPDWVPLSNPLSGWEEPEWLSDTTHLLHQETESTEGWAEPEWLDRAWRAAREWDEDGWLKPNKTNLEEIQQLAPQVEDEELIPSEDEGLEWLEEINLEDELEITPETDITTRGRWAEPKARTSPIVELDFAEFDKLFEEEEEWEPAEQSYGAASPAANNPAFVAETRQPTNPPLVSEARQATNPPFIGEVKERTNPLILETWEQTDRAISTESKPKERTSPLSEESGSGWSAPSIKLDDNRADWFNLATSPDEGLNWFAQPTPPPELQEPEWLAPAVVAEEKASTEPLKLTLPDWFEGGASPDEAEPEVTPSASQSQLLFQPKAHESQPLAKAHESQPLSQAQAHESQPLAKPSSSQPLAQAKAHESQPLAQKASSSQPLTGAKGHESQPLGQTKAGSSSKGYSQPLSVPKVALIDPWTLKPHPYPGADAEPGRYRLNSNTAASQERWALDAVRRRLRGRLPVWLLVLWPLLCAAVIAIFMVATAFPWYMKLPLGVVTATLLTAPFFIGWWSSASSLRGHQPVIVTGWLAKVGGPVKHNGSKLILKEGRSTNGYPDPCTLRIAPNMELADDPEYIYTCNLWDRDQLEIPEDAIGQKVAIVTIHNKHGPGISVVGIKILNDK